MTAENYSDNKDYDITSFLEKWKTAIPLFVIGAVLICISCAFSESKNEIRVAASLVFTLGIIMFYFGLYGIVMKIPSFVVRILETLKRAREKIKNIVPVTVTILLIVAIAAFGYWMLHIGNTKTGVIIIVFDVIIFVVAYIMGKPSQDKP